MEERGGGGVEETLDDGMLERGYARSGTSWAIAMTLVATFERLVRGVTLLCLYRGRR